MFRKKFNPTMIAVVLIALLAGFARTQAQDSIRFDFNMLSARFSAIAQPWESEWVLRAIEYVGDTTCQHNFATEKHSKAERLGCCVLHDSRGCPDNWDVLTKICRKCLRKEIWDEKRILVERTLTEFELLDKRVKEKQRAKSR